MTAVTFFLPQMAFKPQPTVSLPVKLNMAMRSSFTIVSVRPVAQTNTLNPPWGQPISSISRWMESRVGVSP